MIEGNEIMDIFDVLAAISTRKNSFVHSGINENQALMRAERDVSNEYHISLLDIRKLVGERRTPKEKSDYNINLARCPICVIKGCSFSYTNVNSAPGFNSINASVFFSATVSDS